MNGADAPFFVGSTDGSQSIWHPRDTGDEVTVQATVPGRMRALNN